MSNYSAELKAVTLEANTNIPEWIQGPQGPQGIPGKDGKTPIRGVDYWTPQDKQEVIDEAKQGVEIGAQGKSAYEVAVENGFVGTEQEWLASLKGPQGIQGKDGKDGKQGPAGKDGVNGTNGAPGKDGDNGFSPTIVVSENTEDIYKLEITDVNGSYFTPNLKGSGSGGGGGENGATFTPAVSEAGIISWTNDKGLRNPTPRNIKGPEGKQGIQGPNGLPGKDGAKGEQGPKGDTGAKGFSPIVNMVEDGSGVTLTIQDETQTVTSKILNGKDGAPGKEGKPGTPGAIGPVGPAGESGVYRGNKEPVDPEIKVWLDPNGKPDTLVTQEQLNEAIHTTMNIEFQKDGFGNFTANKNDNDINNHRNAGGLVQATYTENGITYTYYYSNMESDRKPTFTRTYIEDNAVKQVLASVDTDKKVTLVEKTVASSVASNGFKFLITKNKPDDGRIMSATWENILKWSTSVDQPWFDYEVANIAELKVNDVVWMPLTAKDDAYLPDRKVYIIGKVLAVRENSCSIHGYGVVDDAAGLKDALKKVETPVATVEQSGKVKPDGTTITVDIDGTIHSVGGGTVGEDGATFTPTVSSEGIISWENNKGLVNPDPVDIKGPKGDAGAKGDTGAIGPQGPIGETGPAGAKGDPGIKGTDATINGVNTLELVQGDNITLSQSGNQLTISAAGGTDVPIATTALAGKVKPDGTTITVDEDGTIHGASGGGSGWDLSDRITAGGTSGLIFGYNGNNGKIVEGNGIAFGTNGGNTDAGLIKAQNRGIVGGYVKNGFIEAGAGPSNLAGGFIFGTARDNGSIDAYSNGVAFGSVTSYQEKMLARNSSVVMGSGSLQATGSGCLVNGHATSGGKIEATGIGAHAEGYVWDAASSILASNQGAHAEGMGTTASGQASHAEGFFTKATQLAQHSSGKYNIEDTGNTYVEIIGCGSSDAPDNAYTLDWLGNGSFKGKVSSTGADYAEYFEWEDSNPNAEDRVGNIVTLDGDKIRYANDGDDILGVVSGTVGVLGDNYEWQWHNKYLTDDFGRVIYDMVEEFSEDPETHEKHSLGMFPHPRLNPDYDDSKPYTKRSDRPEWDAVGMMGKLYVKDDGTAKVNDYITACNGIATKAFAKTNMRVMERIKPNIIRVLMR